MVTLLPAPIQGTTELIAGSAALGKNRNGAVVDRQENNAISIKSHFSAINIWLPLSPR